MNGNRFRCGLVMVFLFLCLSSLGCRSKEKPAWDLESEEGLLANAFYALKHGDYEMYSKLSITPADLMIKKMGLKKSEVSQSYANELRKEQLAKQKSDFIVAVAPGKGKIDFMRSQFVGIGSRLGSETVPDLVGNPYPYSVYSIEIKADGRKLDTEKLSPKFKVVPWQGGYRLLGLIGEDQASRRAVARDRKKKNQREALREEREETYTEPRYERSVQDEYYKTYEDYRPPRDSRDYYESDDYDSYDSGDYYYDGASDDYPEDENGWVMNPDSDY